VDPLTHGVASFALQRAFFPRVSWRSVVAFVSAGVIADVDWFTAALGPSVYIERHRTATHSFLFVVVLAIAAFLFSRSAKNVVGGIWAGFSWLPVAATGLLHLFLDVLQTEDVALLWPFSSRRFALDILPSLEPWLLTILIAAILVPELFLLVNEEIGSRSKRPRGRNGAITGLALAVVYLGFRALLHANTIAALEAHTIAGEMPRRAAAFPDPISPFLWHSIVETQSTLNLVVMRSMGGEAGYASGVITLHKPESSPILTAAQNSPAAAVFVKFARFPKATLQAETEGYSVEIQDLKDQAIEEKSRAIFADVNLDKNSRVISSELQWQKNLTGAR
jgi:inner membrane protein